MSQQSSIRQLDKIRSDAIKLNAERRTRLTFINIWSQTNKVWQTIQENHKELERVKDIHEEYFEKNSTANTIYNKIK